MFVQTFVFLASFHTSGLGLPSVFLEDHQVELLTGSVVPHMVGVLEVSWAWIPAARALQSFHKLKTES